MKISHPILRIAASIGVSLLILGLIFGLLSSESEGVSRAKLMHAVLNVTVSLLVPYILLTVAQTLLRAVRYRLLMKGGGEEQIPGLMHMFFVTAARNMFVDMFPARLGELTYIGMLNKGYEVRGRNCVSSLTISVLFDFAALFVIVVGMLIVGLATSGFQGWLLTAVIGLALLVLCGGWALFFGIRQSARVGHRLLPRKLRGRWINKVIGFVDDMADAMDATRKAGILWQTLVLSLGVRLCKYSGLYFVFLAVTKASFPALAARTYATLPGSSPA